MELELASILVIEDDEMVRAGLVDLLSYHGYRVVAVCDGESGLSLAMESNFDLAIIDVTLPGRDGFSVCNEIREHKLETSIIALTARASDEDICRGFTLGVDDYVTKPFSVHELAHRVKAILRRSRRSETERPFRLGSFVSINPIDLSGMRLSDAKEIRFTHREMQILKVLRRSPTPVSRDELLTSVWGYRTGSLVETRTVDIHMVKLRKKIEPHPEIPKYLVTVRGEGYVLMGAEV